MPEPRKPGESQNDFMGRCMHYMKKNHGDKPHTQQVAICMSYSRDKGAGKKKL